MLITIKVQNDNHYIKEPSGSYRFIRDSNPGGWISGKHFMVNCFGNYICRFGGLVTVLLFHMFSPLHSQFVINRIVDSRKRIGVQGDVSKWISLEGVYCCWDAVE